MKIESEQLLADPDKPAASKKDRCFETLFSKIDSARNLILTNAKTGNYNPDQLVAELEELAHCKEIQADETGALSYEFDHTWRQEDVDTIMDTLEKTTTDEKEREDRERAEISKKIRGGSPKFPAEMKSYGLGGFLPSFLTTYRGKKGEVCAGVSEHVVNWIANKIDTKREIDIDFQDTLATWAQHIQMVPIEKTLTLLRKAKNTPGIVAGRLYSDILASLSFYSDNGYYSDIFRAIALDKQASFEKVSASIDNLISFINQGDSVGYESSGNHAEKALMEIAKKRPEYFLKLKINRAISLPLEDTDIGYKRTVLERENYPIAGYSDEAIQDIFLEFIRDNYDYCRWNERSNYRGAVQEEGYRCYAFGTYARGDSPDTWRGRQKRARLENNVFARIGENYGAQYVSDNSLQIFRTDPKFEADQKRRKEMYGQVDEDDIHFYATLLERHFTRGLIPKSLPYLRGLGLLPEKRKLAILSRYNLHIPEELLGHYTLSEREAYCDEHKTEFEQLFSALKDKQVAAGIVASLREVEKEMVDEAQEKYFGYRSLNTDRLDFFLSFYDQSPHNTRPPHHTFFYWAYMRKFLPETLVKEFEEKYQVRIPASISKIETYDDFLDIPENVLFATFGHLDPEGYDWLRNELVGFADSIKTVLPKAEYISLKDFFRENSIPEEKITDEFIANYRSLMNLKIRSEIEGRLGFSIADLDVRAQIAFLEFLAQADEKGFDSFCSFLVQYSKNDRIAICSAYLAFQDKKDFSYIVERVCRHEGIGLPLMRHIYSLIGNANSTRKFLESEFKTATERESVTKIHTALIKKAYDILLKYNARVADLETMQELASGEKMLRGLYPDTDQTEDNFNTDAGAAAQYHQTYDNARKQIIEEIEKGFTTTSASQTIFLNAIKTLRENGELRSLSEIKGVEPVSFVGPEVPESLRTEMRALYDKNYPIKKGYSQAFRAALFQGLEEAFRNPGSRFHIVTKDGKLLAYLRFDEIGKTEDGRKKIHFGAFNVDTALQGSRIGETFLEELLKRESQTMVIEASADHMVPVSSHYIEKNGFTASGIEPLADRPLLTIRLDTEQSKRLLSKRFDGFTRERIKELAEKGESPREYLSFQKFSSPSELKFPTGNWLMTRYFQEKDGSVYAVFEQAPTVA